MFFFEKPFRLFFDWLKKTHPNIYAIIIAVAILMWVNGVIGLIDYYIVYSNKPFRYSLIMLTGLLIVYLNDGDLTELHADNNTKIKKMMEWGTVASSKSNN